MSLLEEQVQALLKYVAGDGDGACSPAMTVAEVPGAGRALVAVQTIKPGVELARVPVKRTWNPLVAKLHTVIGPLLREVKQPPPPPHSPTPHPC